MITPVALSTAIAEYLRSDEIRSLAHTTQRSYKRVLDTLARVCGPMMANTLGTGHIETCLLDLRVGGSESENEARRRAGLKPRTGRNGRTLNTDRAILKNFTRFLHRSEYLSVAKNPALHLKNAPRKVTRHIVDMILEPGQAVAVLDAADARHPRDRAAVALGLWAALRESEMLELRVSGVDFAAMELRVFRRKQDEWHTAPMAPGLARELRRWFDWLEVRHGALEPDWYVLGARPRPEVGKGFNGVSLTRDRPVLPWKQAWGLTPDIRLAMQTAGVQNMKGKGAHTLRRTAACNLPLEWAKELLGHKQQATTEIYTQYANNKAAVKAAIQEWNPYGLAPEPPPAGDNVIQLADRRRGVA